MEFGNLNFYWASLESEIDLAVTAAHEQWGDCEYFIDFFDS